MKQGTRFLNTLCFSILRHCDILLDCFYLYLHYILYSSATKSSRRGRWKRKPGTPNLPQKRRRNGEEKSAGADNERNAIEDAKNDVVKFTDAIISIQNPDGRAEIDSEKLVLTKNTDVEMYAQMDTETLALKEITDVQMHGEMSTEKLGLTGNTDVQMYAERDTEKLVLRGNTDLQMDATITTVIQEVGLQHVSNGSKEILDDKPQLLPGEETCSGLPFTGQETSEAERQIKQAMKNSHHNEAKGEIFRNESGTSGQHKLNLSLEGSIGGDLIKDVVGHISSSPSEKIAQEETGKTLGIDKCTGAKKRKQGFVRRVRQSPDPEDEDKVDKHNDKKHSDETKSPKMQDPGSSEERDDGARDLCVNEVNMQTIPLLLKILKAVNYSNSYVDGKHDVTVQFKVARYELCLVYLFLHDQEEGTQSSSTFKSQTRMFVSGAFTSSSSGFFGSFSASVC